MTTLLWKPSADWICSTNMTALSLHLQNRYALSDNEHSTVHQWSIENPGAFWENVWSDSKVICSQESSKGLSQDLKWFAGARLNFAENLLNGGNDKDIALVFVGEDGRRRKLTYSRLSDLVRRCSVHLKRIGIAKGDRVAAVLPNSLEAVIGVLATSSIGAIWSACSPELGANGILTRLSQISPKILLTANAYQHNGGIYDCLDKIRLVRASLPSVEQVFIAPLTNSEYELEENERSWSELLLPTREALHIEQLPFDHPLAIFYASSAGQAAPLVHSAGGVLLKNVCELRYHLDLKSESRFCSITDCDSMTWFRQICALACGATVVIYSGSAAFPNHHRIWTLIEEHGLTHMELSPKLLQQTMTAGYQRSHPKDNHDLTSLRVLLATGGPVKTELFEWVYEAVAEHIPLMASCGSDLVGSFLLGNPNLPIIAGETQCQALGMDIRAYDADGKPLIEAEGEMVCITPFPSLPTLWGDTNNLSTETTWGRSGNPWATGERITLLRHGAALMHGNNSTVIYTNGMNIDPVELYHAVEQLPSVDDSIAVGQPWQEEDRLVLLVVLSNGNSLTAALEHSIREVIRRRASPRHVPARILSIAEVPRTKSGHKAERALSRLIRGHVVDAGVVVNQQSLSTIAQLRASLATEHGPSVILSQQEWRQKLDPITFQVTRLSGTERPWTGSLLNEKRSGIFRCICCNTELFRSDAKFDSGCGWPSFFEPLHGANMVELRDTSHGMIRIEIRCRQCDAHLGHVFNDGPPPTGLRYCINSVCLSFEADGEES